MQQPQAPQGSPPQRRVMLNLRGKAATDGNTAYPPGSPDSFVPSSPGGGAVSSTASPMATLKFSGTPAMSPIAVGDGKIRRMSIQVRKHLEDSSSDSDVGEVGGDLGGYLLLGDCEPPSSRPPVATHVVLRVKQVTSLKKKHVAPADDRGGILHFLDGRGVDYQLTTLCILREDEEPPYSAKPRRCVEPRALLRESTRLLDARNSALGRPRQAFWQEEPGQVRVRLKGDQMAVHAGLVVGTQVLGLTAPISLLGSHRRFFQEYELFPPGHAGIGEVIGACRVAIELWPPGSCLSQELEVEGGAGTDDHIGLFSIKASLPAPGLFPDTVGIEQGADDDGSKFRPVCDKCDGLGRRCCSACSGHGALVCEACDGLPPLPCGRCGGTGSIDAGLESIAGVRGGVLATSCGRRCNHCWGSPVTCDTCFGVGALRCGACRGGGWLPCDCGSRATSLWV
eukprot:TRINITY_DN38020_c0_g1_i2.p1 TRINITY_DN38020_c0_g1~~TRINITY_DN38020_c0_g1_i2.p1  ORF type:complete len:453 (-),score=84.37 TRINITY_DN38020_c0_g1_i2:222-1580(-)